MQGRHYIPSTNGYTSVIDFSGKGLFSSSGKKHTFEARTYRDDQEDDPLYTVSGHWDGQFTIHDCQKDSDIEIFDVMTTKTTPLTTDPLSEQDPWESRRAWQGVREALQSGNMQGAADAKAKLENGQREIRNTDNGGRDWWRLFYEDDSETDDVAEMLAKRAGLSLNPADTVGAWKFRRRDWEEGRLKKPYHGGLQPDNTRTDKFESTGGVSDGSNINGVGPAGMAAASVPSSHERSNLTPQSSIHQQTTAPSLEQVHAAPHEVLQERRAPRQDSAARPPTHAELAPQASNIRRDETSRLVSGPGSLPSPSPAEAERPPQADATPRRQEAEVATDEPEMESGIAGMSLKEKVRIEEMLRDRHSSRG